MHTTSYYIIILLCIASTHTTLVLRVRVGYKPDIKNNNESMMRRSVMLE